MSIPTNAEILALLDRLEAVPADDLESPWLDFKPCQGAKEDLRVAVEYSACFANADGGVIVFGVKDRVRGRGQAIEGAKRYDLQIWRQGIFDRTRPNLEVEIEELAVPEGTGRLLLVRVPRGEQPPYGTSDGLFKRRVGKSCMPLESQSFLKARIATGALDWSGEPADGVTLDDLDPIEIARGRNILRRLSQESGLLDLPDADLLRALGAMRRGRITHTGLLLFGREEALSELCPQHQVHYVYQTSETSVSRNDSFRFALLHILERIEQSFSGPANPEHELSLGLFKLRIPAFPLEVVREAILNAITHRDYALTGEVLIRHTPEELTVTSPGSFLPGITPQNILRSEPASRNRTLAEAFEKLRLVERAGIGRRRIFIPLLSYGKRMPLYEADETRVILHLYDGGSFNERMAALVAKWREQGREVDLDTLLVLSFLRDNAFIDSARATDLLQLSREQARAVLDRLSHPATGMLERKGSTRAATYHLAKGPAKDLLGKAAYTRARGIQPIRYAELVKEYVKHYGSITPKEARELLGLGESQTAKVEISRYFRKWAGSEGFLQREGQGRNVRYLALQALAEPLADD